MMVLEQIDVTDLRRAGTTRLNVAETYRYPDFQTLGPVAVEARITVTDTGVILAGHFTGEIEEPCDRCLLPYHRTLSSRFEERYVDHVFLPDSLTGGGEVQLQQNDFYDTLGADGILDLKDMVRQYVIMALSLDRICGGPACMLSGQQEA
jgi:uncharacterized metal-binding protein YceD (DUF177 family)